MKNLKKLLAVACALALMLTFVGCGGSGMTVEDGKLIMATNAAFPPYEYVENGEYAGIDVEIAGLIAEELGLELEIVDIQSALVYRKGDVETLNAESFNFNIAAEGSFIMNYKEKKEKIYV